ncbi:glycosyltransferase [Polaribacter undariae]|uniref:Glycosyltransferase n=1 Tax=Polaribacter sejongensis TaxID=985043 RepID=A0AAJ1QW34_9FLAO|nr:glycosyltransferase [Polaribacter undariae]MDN3619155.1 glycosyltransferase [Polaribacter undariae]UWD33644.1 glycosyltransferase [Polaribacter undariae]
MKKVLIAYHYISHYRIPIFNLLSKNDKVEYTILAGEKTDIKIKTADIELSKIPPKNGGIRWEIISNYWFLKYFLIQPSLLKKCFTKKYDTIIFLGTMYYLTTWMGAVIARLRGKKVIFWSHGYIKDEKNIKGFIRFVFYSLANEILVYGQRAKDILIAKGFPESKVSLIYNSLNYDKQKQIRNNIIQDLKKEEFFKNDLPIFGFIGRLTKQKKIDLLLLALAEINKDAPKSNLLIIGDGDQIEILKQKSNELGLNDFVCFYGPCYDEEKIFKLITLLKVVVSPGEVGLTAIHSLTFGVPVVTHNRFDMQMPEYEAIIEGDTGSFFDYNNPIPSLVEKINEWIYLPEDNLIKEKCFRIIDEYYNPYTQNKIFDNKV